MGRPPRLRSALLLVTLASTGAAQEAAPVQPSADDDVAREILRPGQYTYQPEGRRDPFVSLLEEAVPVGTGPVRPPGLPGFLVSEVTLKGIVESEGEFIAMFAANDGQSYFARVGQELFDGALIAMDEATATFRQDVRAALSSVRTREVVKSLYPSEEARR